MMEDLPFFCGWGWDFSLSLEKEFEGATGVILRWIIFFWVVKLPRLHDAQLWIVFSFKYRSKALCMILRDSGSLVSLLLFVISAYNFIVGTLSSSCGAVCFKIYFSRWRSFTVLWSGSKDYVWLFTAIELSSCIASFETTANLETCTFLRWLWICCCVVFVRLCFAELGITRILSRCWRKNAKIFVKMDTECWKLLVKKVFSLKELVIIIQKL